MNLKPGMEEDMEIHALPLSPLAPSGLLEAREPD